MERINTIFGDTETCPMGWGSRASRNTAIGGMAVKKAAEDARGQILKAASEKMEVHPDDLDIKNSTVFVKSAPSRSMSVADVVRFNRYRPNGQAVMAKAHWDAPSTLADKVTGKGNFSMAFSFGAKAIEVEVDPGTGALKIAGNCRLPGSGKGHQSPGGRDPDRRRGAYGTGLCHERRNRSG